MLWVDMAQMLTEYLEHRVGGTVGAHGGKAGARWLVSWSGARGPPFAAPAAWRLPDMHQMATLMGHVAEQLEAKARVN